MSNAAPTTSPGQASKLAALLDALDGVVISRTLTMTRGRSAGGCLQVRAAAEGRTLHAQIVAGLLAGQRKADRWGDPFGDFDGWY